MATTSPLRQRMIEDMMIRNLSRATQQSYIYAVARFSRHFNSSPDRLGMEEVRAYQLHLVAKNHSWSHINQVACALRFFYGVTLGQKEAFERIVFGREPEKLPAVLNAEEVVRFLEAVEGLRNRIALTTAYAAGLRVREVTRLRIASIDSTRMLIHIEMGKGGKERYAMLSPRLLYILRTYWRRARPSARARNPAIMWARAPCRTLAAGRESKPGSTSPSPRIRCGTVSPPISWRLASTFASFRRCSAMPTCLRRRAMHMSPRT